MEQTRLFRLAPEAMTAQAHYRPGEGWVLVVRVRRGDESWEEASEGFYSHLVTSELLDVLQADLERALGL